jgi:hypothetical protein
MTTCCRPAARAALLERPGRLDWADLSAEGGDGVTFARLVEFTDAARPPQA